MKTKCALLLVLSLCIGISAIEETIDLITGMSCGVTSNVQGGLVVSHQPFDILPPISNNIVCFFQMRAPRFRQKIRFMFTHFALTPMDCSLSNLTFYNGTSDTDPVIATICPDSADVLTTEYTSTSYWLTLKLQVSSDSAEQRTANFSGYYVSYTDDRDPCQDPDNEMMCDNGRCVFQVLQCDNYDSCGDNTDESTGAPSFCGSSTAPPVSPSPVATVLSTPSSSQAATTTTTTSVAAADEPIFSDLTPLYIVLSIATAMLIGYFLYVLLSFQWFNKIMVACLHRCCLLFIRRRRKWRESENEAKKRTERKVSPEKRDSMKLVNLSTAELPRNAQDPAIGKESSFAFVATGTTRVSANGIGLAGKTANGSTL